MARPRKPGNLKAVENSRNRNPERAIGPEPVPTGLLRGEDAPAHFNDEEAAVWTEVLDATPHGLLRKLDRSVFIMWVQAWSIRDEAYRKLRAGSLLVKTTNGNFIQNPFLSVVNKQTSILKSLAGEMGFTPAARTKIALEEGGDGEDETDRFF